MIEWFYKYLLQFQNYHFYHRLHVGRQNISPSQPKSYNKTNHIMQLDVDVLSYNKWNGVKIHIETETLNFATEKINTSIFPIY
jgi:hypothetical protein